MKYVVCVVLVLWSFHVNGQMVCKVYQQNEGMESKKCVLTRTYDELGRPVKEKIRGYAVCLEDVYTMYCCKEDGIYDYYYDDTMLYKIVITELDDVTRMPMDSGKVFYHYDSASGILRDDLTVKHLKIRRPGVKPGGYRNTVTYRYNKDGSVAVKEGAAGLNTAEYYFYDSKGRLVCDSLSYFGDDFKMVTRYEYTYDGFRKFAWSNERKYPEITVCRTDMQGRVTDMATWFHKDEDKDGGRGVRTFNWSAYLGKDLSRFKQFDRTITKYNEQGRIAETQYYFAGKRTTTHLFVYEKGGV